MLCVNYLTSRLIRDQRGATSIEYGLIALLVGVGLLIGLRALGQANDSSWNGTAEKISSAMAESGK